MKFLCVPCDAPMKLEETSGPTDGSFSLRFACPECGYEFAMLTNPLESQMVSSLGVKLGGEAGAEAGASKCPFTGVVREMTAAAEQAEGVPWTAEARARLEGIPIFIRPMAKSGIERFAQEHGYPTIDESVLDEARSHFGM